MGIRGPSVRDPVVVVVGVRVVIVLVTVQTKLVSVEVVLGLQNLRVGPSALVPDVAMDCEKRHSDGKEPEERKLLVLSLHDVSNEQSSETSSERSRVSRLNKLDVIITGKSMITDCTRD